MTSAGTSLKNNPWASPMRHGAGERGKWDFGRFVRTVSYFNKPPSPGEVLSAIVSQPAKVLSSLTGGTTEVEAFSWQPSPRGFHGTSVAPITRGTAW